METTNLRDAAADLVLGSSCLGCARPGRLVCHDCRARLPREPLLAWPTPTPPGLVPPFAAGPYDGLLKELVLGLKERGLHGLVAPIGEVLGGVVAGIVPSPGSELVLVPVPSRPASVRARGLDSTLAVARRTARLLRAGGTPARVAPLLRTRPGLVDQAGLSAAARQANLAGSMTCPSPGLHRLAARCPRALVVVVDDVITTGATAREAQRALGAVGLDAHAVAAVAATRRRPREAP